MAPPAARDESPAEAEARIRRKNRRIIPWIIAACLAPFVVLAALLAVILVPALIKIDRIMREAPANVSPVVAMERSVTGDFDRDGRPDLAGLQRSGDHYQLVIRRAAPDAVPIVVESLPAGLETNYFLALAKPGTYPTWCGKGGATEEEPCPFKTLTLSGDVLVFGVPEASNSVAVWNGETFTTVQLSG